SERRIARNEVSVALAEEAVDITLAARRKRFAKTQNQRFIPGAPRFNFDGAVRCRWSHIADQLRLQVKLLDDLERRINLAGRVHRCCSWPSGLPDRDRLGWAKLPIGDINVHRILVHVHVSKVVALEAQQY